MPEAETWFVVIDATGECRSLGTRVANPLPAGLEAIALSPSDAAAILNGAGAWIAERRAVGPLPAPVPDAVTPWQFFTWLFRKRGITPAQVEALIASLPEPQRSQAKIDVDRANEFRRHHPLVAEFFSSLGATQAETDDAFREMSGLN